MTWLHSPRIVRVGGARERAARRLAGELGAEGLVHRGAHRVELVDRARDGEAAAERVGEVVAQHGGAGEGADEHGEEEAQLDRVEELRGGARARGGELLKYPREREREEGASRADLSPARRPGPTR